VERKVTDKPCVVRYNPVIVGEVCVVGLAMEKIFSRQTQRRMNGKNRRG
jgi:hypothetical protein